MEKRQKDMRLAQQIQGSSLDYANGALSRLDSLYGVGHNYQVGQYYQKQEFTDIMTHQDWRQIEAQMPIAG